MDQEVIIDIVFATTEGQSTEIPSNDHIEDKISLGPDLWIGQNLNSYWNAVYRSCTPQGHNFSPHPQFGPRYAVWNDEPAGASGPAWDLDKRLATTIALSRLVHPTSIGLEYSARLELDSERNLRRVIPEHVSGLLAHAYIADGSKPNFLTPSQAYSLADLIARFDTVANSPVPFSWRLHRALWNYDYASHVEWTEVRWTIVVTALEALIGTCHHRVTKQFVNRVTALASQIGVSFNKRDAKRVYALRSQLVHGDKLPDIDGTTRDLYCRMEDVLRGSIRKAVEDKSFRSIFQSNQSIENHFI